MFPIWWTELFPTAFLRSLLLAGLLVLLSGPAAWANQVYTLAVVPQFTAVDIGQRWTPLLERIRQKTGISFQIRTSANIPAFEAEFLDGIPDFVFLNPYHMVMAAKSRGYTPVVRSNQPLHGILIVNKDSPVKKVSDLEDATIAFPAPNAFGASLYMRALLSEQEKLAYTPSYVGTHQNVFRHVILGDAQAGGGVDHTLQTEPPTVRDRLRILYRTPDTPSHPLAVHPRVPREVTQALFKALQQLAQEDQGRKLLARVELDGAIPAHYGRDYAPLERLKLERYVVRSQK